MLELFFGFFELIGAGVRLLLRVWWVAVLEPKRVPQSRDLHISGFHHNPQDPRILAEAAYAPVSKRFVPHSTT